MITNNNWINQVTQAWSSYACRFSGPGHCEHTKLQTLKQRNLINIVLKRKMYWPCTPCMWKSSRGYHLEWSHGFVSVHMPVGVALLVVQEATYIWGLKSLIFQTDSQSLVESSIILKQGKCLKINIIKLI